MGQAQTAAPGRGYDGPAVPGWAKRLTPPDSETPARSKMAIDRLIARREVHLREKTLWRMLYETVARAEEILGVNIEELDLAGRRAPVKAKGARGEVPAQEGGERTEVFPPLPGGDRRSHQPARSGRPPTLIRAADGGAWIVWWFRMRMASVPNRKSQCFLRPGRLRRA